MSSTLETISVSVFKTIVNFYTVIKQCHFVVILSLVVITTATAQRNRFFNFRLCNAASPTTTFVA